MFIGQFIQVSILVVPTISYNLLNTDTIYFIIKSMVSDFIIDGV